MPGLRTTVAGVLATALAAVVVVRLATHPLGRLVVVAGALAAGAVVAYTLSRPAAYERLRVGVGRRVLVRPTADDGADGPCASCGDAVAGGERRRFVREAVVLGVPLVVLDDGTNAYCEPCAADRDPLAEADFDAVATSLADVAVVDEADDR